MSSTQILPPTTPFGLTPQGLSVWRQTDWQQSLEAGFQQIYGVNAKLDAQSINGQIINTMAERLALVTELLEAIYSAQYPGGGEGVAVDNQLQLVGLTRNQATATITAPDAVQTASGLTRYGLLLFGTPGTVVPAGTLLGDGSSPPNTFSLDADVTIGAAQNAQQAVSLSAAPTSGAYALTLQLDGGTAVTTPAIDYRALPSQTLLIFPSDDDYTYTLTASGQTTVPIAGQADPATLAAALNTALGVTTITAGTTSAGIVINWPAGTIAQVTSSGQGAPTVIDAVQAAINSVSPFGDVAVSGGPQALLLQFGAYASSSSSTNSAAQAIPLVQVASNTLAANSTSVNLRVRSVVNGQPAQGVGSATCTQTGPIAVAQGALSNVQTPLQGLSGCTNPLACVTGRAVETDSEALARRATQLSASAQGPTAAVLQRVQNLSGVTTALAFVNATNAAQQLLVFAAAPTTGSYSLVFDTGTTSSLPYNATAAQVQQAVRQLDGLGGVVVTGSAAFGMRIDFAGAQGGQAQPLVQVVSNSTDTTITPYFGRYPHALEMVVEGGDNVEIAQQIYQAAPAGYGTYGAAVARPTISTTLGSPSVTVSDASSIVTGQTLTAAALPRGCTVVAIAGLSLTMSAGALATVSNQPSVVGYSPRISDSNGNALIVNFSRPQAVPIYVQVQVLTDEYLAPGDPSSGSNPNAKWTPANVATIQADVLACLAQVPIGGQVLGLGTNGVRACISSIPGMVSYEVFFDLTPSPTNTAPISLLENQVLLSDLFNIAVSWR